MSLSLLKASGFRNLIELDLELGSQFNLIYGINGSGKTSILEAIYFLGLGRSFRSHLNSRIIQHQAPRFSVFGAISLGNNLTTTIGIEKSRSNKTKIKIGADTVSSTAELAKLMPIQLINPDSYLLLTAGPRHRREFLDWGVFHVEQSFFPIWQRFQRALKQRNAALQMGATLQHVRAWDNELLSTAADLTSLRRHYIEQLVPIVTTLLLELIDLPNLTFNYQQGWDQQLELAAVLNNNFSRDSAMGYTQYGPQRADIGIRVNNIPVQDVLSRGEQKLLVCALRLGQSKLLWQLSGKRCIYMLDDLAAELDYRRRVLIIKALNELQAQVLITAVDSAVGDSLQDYSTTKMFHVEQGLVRQGAGAIVF